ncbi:hypothetical protein [Bogoriella caseilytica]|uniref:Uncharacterized protein n=1 Tax=Bogoriella caseilytica TaxID=56055 RepID=A0A3N2BGB9_9MICO|nr:hypothetical protein [Bogoriella caseilytica]ROR74270.1 hypothetical protein EDD31_2674 [Bogoriella caseilytica]
MRRQQQWVLALATITVLGACQSGDLPTGAATLDEAVAEANDLITDLIGAVPAELVQENDPIYSPCLVDDGPREETAQVSQRVSFAAEDAERVLTDAQEYLAERGTQGLQVTGAETDTPLLVGVFGDQAWQVAVRMNRGAGVGGVLVNTPCLPHGDRED